MIKTTWKGIRRSLGAAQHGKDPILTADLLSMVDCLPDSIAGTRDRCLLLLGFSSALRRSELVGFDIEDLGFRDQGLVLEVRRSKTDQDGRCRRLGVPWGEHPISCPVRATSDWIRDAALESGPLFRAVDRFGRPGTRRLSDRAVALIVKRSASRAGLDPTRVAGHSLRAGFATAAAQAGLTESQIMRQTGHRSVTVLRRYIRDASLFDGNPASGLGL